MIVERLNHLARRLPTWAVYAVCFLPMLWLLYLALNNGLGRDPVKALEHELGALALQLLIAGLCITPLRRLAGVNLLKFRRALGLMAFAYVCLHLLVWLVLDVQIPAQIWADIIKRPYVMIGMAAFVLMIPLAATSNAMSLRKLGVAAWQRLHRLTYLVAVLGALHFLILAKGFQIEPLLYLCAVILLVASRIPRAFYSIKCFRVD